MKIAMIGAGAMGGATVEGLIKGEFFKNENITVADPSQQVLEKFARQGVSVTTDNQMAAHDADIVCVCVKPWLVEQVLTGIKDVLNPQKQILIVIAAGVRRCVVSEDQGVAARLSASVPDDSQYRHCPTCLDDLYCSVCCCDTAADRTGEGYLR